MRTKLDTALSLGVGKLLRIRIGYNELNTLELRIDHVVYGIRAATAYADDSNAGGQFNVRVRGRGKVQSHDQVRNCEEAK
ncbi:hypothetical protein AA0228_2237 [Gluconobacter frateurii NRIC 0228]|uniref:Uncharacterized protein n=1 Tax=Gluconobacter frateurii NRIC 0228 TaxID=1307946 RepID=A0ABQ0QDB5_9PROT|nr:hypothetical protein AA0228_2237 [Gluconobacter frateurii NRIC 0228]